MPGTGLTNYSGENSDAVTVCVMYLYLQKLQLMSFDLHKLKL